MEFATKCKMYLTPERVYYCTISIYYNILRKQFQQLTKKYLWLAVLNIVKQLIYALT